MTFNRNLILGAVAAVMAGSVAFAASHGENPAVKARKAHMQLYAHNLGILGGMAKGTAEFNADAAQAAANNLASLSTLNQMSYWAADTSSMDLENTRTLPALWDNIPDAMAKGQALAEAASAMQAAAGSLEGVQASIGAVGGACGACHKAYRQPDS